MAAFDSVAEFRAALDDQGLGHKADEFAAKGVDTFSALAYMSSYRPGGDERVFDERVLKVLLGSPEDANAPRVRRLHADAYAMGAHRMERMMSATSDDPPQKLPQAERGERVRKFNKTFTGRDTGEEYDPSHRLIDAAHALVDKNAVVYIDLEQCTTRRQEIDGEKTDRVWRRGPRGVITEHDEKSHGNASVADLMRFKQALQRRATALHVARVVDFEAMQAWSLDLIACIQEPVAPGYTGVDINRALTADRTLWRKIAYECSDGVKSHARTPLDDTPFARALAKWQQRPEVRVYLSPLPAGSAGRNRGGRLDAGASGRGSGGEGDESSVVSDLRKQMAEMKRKLNNAIQQSDRANKAAKGKGKRQGQRQRRQQPRCQAAE